MYVINRLIRLNKYILKSEKKSKKKRKIIKEKKNNPRFFLT